MLLEQPLLGIFDAAEDNVRAVSSCVAVVSRTKLQLPWSVHHDCGNPVQAPERRQHDFVYCEVKLSVGEAYRCCSEVDQRRSNFHDEFVKKDPAPVLFDLIYRYFSAPRLDRDVFKSV